MNFNLVIETDCWGEKCIFEQSPLKNTEQKDPPVDPPLRLCLSPFRLIFAFKSRNN